MFPCVRSFQSAAATRTCFTRSSRTSSSTTGELSSCPELILSAPSPRFVVLLSLVVSSHRRFRRLVVSSSRCLVVSSSRRTVVSSSRRLVASLFRRFDCFVVSSSRRLVVSSSRRFVVSSSRRLVASLPRRLVVSSSRRPRRLLVSSLAIPVPAGVRCSPRRVASYHPPSLVVMTTVCGAVRRPPSIALLRPTQTRRLVPRNPLAVHPARGHLGPHLAARPWQDRAHRTARESQRDVPSLDD